MPKLTPAAAALVLALGALPAAAQVGTGGKGDGFPGGGGGPLTGEALAYHLLDRITFGHTEEDLAQVRRMGAEGYIRWQLEPERIPESPELLARLAALPPAYTPAGDAAWVWQSLWAEHPLRARYTSRQLNEVMVDFWLNHFDTALSYGNDAGTAGLYSSLAFDPAGNPVMAHVWNNIVEVATFVGGRWISTHADPLIPKGAFPSLAFDPASGKPAVAFYEPDWPEQSARGDLHFSRFDGTSWRAEVVDGDGDVGAWCSLRFATDGRPVIAYQDRSQARLKLATSGAAGWDIEVVDSGGAGAFASLALDSADLPVVAYYDESAGAIRCARFDGSAWSFSTVADDVPAIFLDWGADPAPPRLLDVEIDPATDQPAVAYHDPVSADLRYSSFDGAAWSTAWVDTPGDVGLYPSLSFDASGRPAIAYLDAGGYDLKLARHDGLAWGTETALAGPAIAGPWSSLAFDAAGRPAVSYHNGSTFALDLARFNGSLWWTQVVATQGPLMRQNTIWQKEMAGAFRERGLGCFRDLLGASAMSPAMMVFLNNDMNIAGSGNENYARELLELHTLGVEGGYAQIDVETVARAFTGWTQVRDSPRCDLVESGFCYNHSAHDGREKTVLGVTLAADSPPGPASWMKQGNEILDLLAAQPATARFVCGKLIEKLVADRPPERLWSECAATFLQSGGEMRRVLETILLSAEFRDPASSRNKVRKPLEYTLAAVRNLEAASDGLSLYPRIEDQGEAVFFNSIPTGWPEGGRYWATGNSFLQRWKLADWLTHSASGTTIDPLALVRRAGIDRADAILEHFLGRLVRGRASAAVRSRLLDCLNGGDPGPVSLSDPAFEARLRDTIGMILGLPEVQKQ